MRAAEPFLDVMIVIPKPQENRYECGSRRRREPDVKTSFSDAAIVGRQSFPLLFRHPFALALALVGLLSPAPAGDADQNFSISERVSVTASFNCEPWASSQTVNCS
jgi:hypothetical protein